MKKKYLLISVVLILMINIAAAQYTDSYLYEFGTAHNGNEGFSKCGGTGTIGLGTNYFVCGGDCSEGIGIYKRLNISANSGVNMTLYMDLGTTYNAFGFTNNCAGTTSFGVFRYRNLVSDTSNYIRAWENDTLVGNFLDVDCPTSVPTGKNKVQFVINSSIYGLGYEFYLNDVFICEGNYSLLPDEEVIDFVLWSRNTDQYFYNVSILYNSISPFFVLQTNMVNNTLNFNEEELIINYSAFALANTPDIFNCSLYNDGELNQTDLDINITIPQNFTLDIGLIDNEVKGFEVYCENEDISDSSGEYFYTIDTIQPNIYSDFVNNSVFEQLDIIEFYVNFTDTNLIAYNISFFLNDTIKENIFANNITGGYSENRTTRTAADLGNYEIEVFVWDSHTRVDVSNINWYWENGKLYTNNLIFEGNIKIYNNKDELVSYFYKDFDRYKLKMTFEEESINHGITITAPDWYYIGDIHGYKGHFINLATNQWLDFEGNNVKNVEVINLGDNQYRINVEHYTLTDEIEFESLGDLNTGFIKYEYQIIEQIVITPNTTTTTLNTSGLEESLDSISEGVNVFGLHILLILSLALYIFMNTHTLSILNSVISMVLLVQYHNNNLLIFGYIAITILILEIIKIFSLEQE